MNTIANSLETDLLVNQELSAGIIDVSSLKDILADIDNRLSSVNMIDDYTSIDELAGIVNRIIILFGGQLQPRPAPSSMTYEVKVVIDDIVKNNNIVIIPQDPFKINNGRTEIVFEGDF